MHIQPGWGLGGGRMPGWLYTGLGPQKIICKYNVMLQVRVYK